MYTQTHPKVFSHAHTHALSNLLGVGLNPRTFFFLHPDTHSLKGCYGCAALSLVVGTVPLHRVRSTGLRQSATFLIQSDLCIVDSYPRVLSPVRSLSSHFQTVGMALPLILNKYMGLLVAGRISQRSTYFKGQPVSKLEKKLEK